MAVVTTRHSRPARRERRGPGRDGETGELAPVNGREVVVLGDGPWARHWYWRDDLEAMQAASRAVGYPDQHPAAVLRHYRPTDQHQRHPDDPGRDGKVWTFHPPAPPTDTPADTGANAGDADSAAAGLIPAPRAPLDEQLSHDALTFAGFPGFTTTVGSGQTSDDHEPGHSLTNPSGHHDGDVGQGLWA